ncbi:MAG: SDR family NAD(P)-dependent oxidoreductase [Bacteroidota bacterium]
MNLAGAIALITGAGRGIGRTLALTLARNGTEVVLTARTKSELDLVRNEITSEGGKAHALEGDLTNDRDIERMFRHLRETFGRLDILVNNAGIGRFAPIKDLAVHEFDAMWNLNMRALFLCTQQALPLMIPQRRGAIVNISSLAGKNAFVGGGGYSATKWALLGFSKTLMLEVREHNIRVVTICPGSVDTTFSSAANDPARSEKIIHPQDIADTLITVLTLPDRTMVSEIDIRPTNPK